MLSIGAMAAGQGRYYLGLAREDYYLEGGEPPGKWWGQGAKALGIQGTVDRPTLEATLAGYHPDGSRLVQNAGAPKRQPGWDLTFSAPKSVSVFWAVAGADVRREIQAAQEAAVHEALRYLEDEASISRRGKAGTERERAGVLVATFEHGTSRALDPNLHTHCLVLNAAVRLDGTTGTLLSQPLYQHKMTAGAIYRAHLAHELERRLGLVSERVRSWFELLAVPRNVLGVFSKRRAAIEERLDAMGLESASAAAFATLATRQPKDLVPPRGELFASWSRTAAEQGFTRGMTQGIDRSAAVRDPAHEYTQALDESLRAITYSQSHFSADDLLRRVAESAQTRGLSARFIRETVENDLERYPEIVRLGEVASETRYTTREMLGIEEDLLQAVERLRSDPRHAVSAKTVERVMRAWAQPPSALAQEAKHHATQVISAAAGKKTERIDRKVIRERSKRRLSPEQADAVRRLTRDTGAVQLVSGMAGTGKTTLLRACREAWEKDGFTVLGATLSGKAARELEKGSGIASDTLAKRFWDTDHRSIRDRVKHDARQIWRAARGKSTHPFDRFRLTQKTVLVVDEASMVGTRQMKRLVDEVERSGAKLVLVGDARQLQAIEAGGAFDALLRRFPHAKLANITRQREEWARESVREFAQGDAKAALKRYAEKGLLHVSKTRRQAMEQLVRDWAVEGRRKPQDHVIFVGTNVEARLVNHLCQQRTRRLHWTPVHEKVRVDREVIYKGDRVLFTKRSKRYQVENGDLGTVIHANALTKKLVVTLDRGGEVTIPIRKYKDVRLGYAITTHKGQGATVGHAYILAGGAMQDRELSYVQASRAVEKTRFYIDQHEAGQELANIARQMSRSHAKQMAHDVNPEREQSQRIAYGR